MTSAHEPVRESRVPGAGGGEPIGGVNAYIARTKAGVTTHVFVTVNLAAGTTPFQATFDCDGDKVDACSCAYHLPFNRASADFGWYRPGRDEFDRLSPDERRHVLLGGLLLAPLAVAISRQCWYNPERVTPGELGRIAANMYGLTKATEEFS